MSWARRALNSAGAMSAARMAATKTKINRSLVIRLSYSDCAFFARRTGGPARSAILPLHRPHRFLYRCGIVGQRRQNFISVFGDQGHVLNIEPLARPRIGRWLEGDDHALAKDLRLIFGIHQPLGMHEPAKSPRARRRGRELKAFKEGTIRSTING